MEVIEKVKEVENTNNKQYASKAVGNTALGLSIGALALELFGKNRNSLLTGGSLPENININNNSGSAATPSAFNVWEKECNDMIKSQADLYNLALTNQYNRYNDSKENDAKFFNLYKSTRDSFDITNKRITDDGFALYKNQRDSYDILISKINELEKKQAIADAIEPWRTKVFDMTINQVNSNAQNGIALEAERRSCADNKIVNYTNSTFYPIEVADITIGTTATARNTYNPLCPCYKSF